MTTLDLRRLVESAGHTLATVLLGPLLLLQARRVRRDIDRLPEAAGPRRGVEGTGPPLRLLITGDSSAAGVGAAYQREALAGQVVTRLASRFRVEWTLCARTGATTSSILTMLQTIEPRPFDVAVTALGVNDVTSRASRRRWRVGQAELRALLRSTFGVSYLVVSGLPPMHGFPALPQPLRWYLGTRARQFDRDLATDVGTDPQTSFIDNTVVRDVRLMAADGFHPGPGVYAVWGEQIAERIIASCQAALPEPCSTSNTSGEPRPSAAELE